MKQLLKDNNYIFVPNFIEKQRAKVLAKTFQDHCAKNNLIGDSQAPNSHSKYNFIDFLELLCEKTPEISDIVDETVIPTYSYARVYKKGSVLEKHTDREECEVSLTVHLDGDIDWPIFIETPSGETKSIVMKPGDAMIYLGCVAPHWRNEYSGNQYTQVFLHYVLSKGNNSSFYFDKFNPNTLNKSDQKLNEEKQDFVNYSDYENKLKEKETKVDNYSVNSHNIITPNCNSTLKEFIHVIDNVFPEDLCNRIIKEYKDSQYWSAAEIASKERPVSTDYRNCNVIPISDPNIMGENYAYRKKLDEEIFDKVSYAVAKYAEMHSEFHINVDTGYELLRYKEGNFYKQHVDSFKEQQRSVSCSIQLNEDYIGGEFAFFDRELVIRASVGSVILFPSNFMFPHEIMPVIEGTRYSIITWLV